MGSSRERIVEAGATLFRRQGYTGTGVKQIVDTASAPFASLYHFFPGGKEELAAEIIRWAGELYGQLVDVVHDGPRDPVKGVAAFYGAAAATLRDTDYADACPIATIALETSSTSEPLREACAEVFESWIDKGTARFVDAGIPHERARELSVICLSLLEGAFVLCRATRTTEPLDIVGAAAAALVADALPARHAPRKRSRARG